MADGTPAKQLASQTCTREEVLKFMSAVCYQVAAPSVAHRALQAGAKAAGWEGLPGELLNAAAPAEPTPKKKGRKAKGDDDEARKPRHLSSYNVFNTLVMDSATKEPWATTFKMPAHTNKDGQVASRGTKMMLVGSCWKALSDEDKAKFNTLVAPGLETLNETISAGQKPAAGAMLEVITSTIREEGQESQLSSLLHKAMKEGLKAANAAAAAGGADGAGPSSAPSDSHAGNGTADKKRKKEEKDKEAKKVKKEVEVKKEKSKEKEKEMAKEKTEIKKKAAPAPEKKAVKAEAPASATKASKPAAKAAPVKPPSPVSSSDADSSSSGSDDDDDSSDE